jgi:multicomponent K+:H+ antiporter subunit E
MSAILSAPFTILGVAVLWVLLSSSIAPGTIVLGLAVGVLVAWTSAAYWPDRPRLRHPLKILAYIGIVIWDIVVSSIEVTRLILTRRGSGLRSHFVTVPLDVTSPEAIAVLAGTITMTPGTVSADLSADGTKLLVHCLETDDPDATVAGIKRRYEDRLKEIFP